MIRHEESGSVKRSRQNEKRGLIGEKEEFKERM